MLPDGSFDWALPRPDVGRWKINKRCFQRLARIVCLDTCRSIGAGWRALTNGMFFIYKSPIFSYIPDFQLLIFFFFLDSHWVVATIYHNTDLCMRLTADNESFLRHVGKATEKRWQWDGVIKKRKDAIWHHKGQIFRSVFFCRLTFSKKAKILKRRTYFLRIHQVSGGT